MDSNQLEMLNQVNTVRAQPYTYVINRTGYQNTSWAENIAFRTIISISEFMRQWLTSHTVHCRNIMNANRTEIGMAKYTNEMAEPGESRLRRYWTQIFTRLM